MGDMRDDFENAIADTDGADALLEENEQEIITSGDDGDDNTETENSKHDADSESESETGGETGEDTGGSADSSTSAESENLSDAEKALADKTAGAEAGGKENGEDSEDKELSDKDSLKAPANWSPTHRSNWSKLPQDMQRMVLDREAEFTQAQTQIAENGKAHNFLEGIQRSFAPVLAAEGVNAPQAIQGLFETVSRMRMGTPQQKAEAVAGIIKDYGISVSDLDDVLVGQPVQETQASEVQRLVNEQLAPMREMMGQHNNAKVQHQQHQQQTAVNDVAEFSKNAEFINDVRNDMADLIDMAQARGVDMPLQEAYDKACAIHPEIVGVMSERAKAAALVDNQAVLAAKQAAASSLSGKQHGLPAGSGNMSMRDTLLSAWDGE